MTPAKALDYLARFSKKNPVAKRALKKFKGLGDDASEWTYKQLKSLEKTVDKVRGMNPEGQKAPTDVVGRAARLLRRANPDQVRGGILTNSQRAADKLKAVGAAATGAAGAAGVVGTKVAYDKGRNKGREEGRKNLEQTADFAIEMTDREAKTNEKSYGGKVTRRKAGGKIGRGCGAALRGGGRVMR